MNLPATHPQTDTTPRTHPESVTSLFESATGAHFPKIPRRFLQCAGDVTIFSKPRRGSEIRILSTGHGSLEVCTIPKGAEVLDKG